MKPLFPERMLFVEWGDEFVLQKNIGSNLLLESFPHYISTKKKKNLVLHHLIQSSVQFWCFGFKQQRDKWDAERHCPHVPAVSSSWCFNESESARSLSLESRQTLAGTVSYDHRGSQHPQTNQQAKRGGQAAVHLSRPVILIACINRGPAGIKQAGWRVAAVTKRSTKGQIVPPNGVLSTAQQLVNIWRDGGSFQSTAGKCDSSLKNWLITSFSTVKIVKIKLKMIK